MAKNMRVHELAKELGMTNAETMDLASALGVPVKSHSSSLNEAYADMIRRRAVRDGLTRDEQPEEPKPAKKTARKATTKKAAPEVVETVAVTAADEVAADDTSAPAPAAPAPAAEVEAPADEPTEPAAEPERVTSRGGTLRRKRWSLRSDPNVHLRSRASRHRSAPR